MELSSQAMQTYGYLFIAACMALASLGAPLPASLIATAAGGLVASGELNPVTTLLTVLLACVSGDLGGYTLGRAGGRRLAMRYGRWLGLKRLDQLELFVNQWGGPMLILSRSLLAIAASGVNFLAGVSRQRLRTFLTYDVVGRLIWTVAFVGLGYFLEDSAEGAADIASSMSGVVGVACLAMLALMLNLRRRRRDRVPQLADSAACNVHRGQFGRRSDCAHSAKTLVSVLGATLPPA